MTALLAALILLQAAPAQTEADKFEAALKKFGERTYRITEKGKAVGAMTLKTRIEKDGDRKVAVLEDTVEFDVGHAAVEINVKETAALDGLNLIFAERTAGKIEITASIRDGDAYLTVDQSQWLIRNIRNVQGELSVLRIVGMKKQEVGSAFKADVFVLESPSDELNHDFKCVAKETIEIGGKKVEAFKWEQKWKGKAIRGGESVDASIENTYWIGADGTLLRFKIGQNEMTLDAK
ncbi:MAG TPA: hypothetical protein VFS19_06805 [Planctomycetota bacterium]|nr:hypothetical protein [Planctomycetota bacterium]